jgi:hypothetical protein
VCIDICILRFKDLEVKLNKPKPMSKISVFVRAEASADWHSVEVNKDSDFQDTLAACSKAIELKLGAF